MEFKEGDKVAAYSHEHGRIVGVVRLHPECAGRVTVWWAWHDGSSVWGWFHRKQIRRIKQKSYA